MFYDEAGKRKRTKQEIIDESRKIRKGCKIIPKGEVYERQQFGKKKVIFKNYTWLETIKQQYTELINRNLFKLSEENTLTFFNPNGSYMPMQKISKNNPLVSDIEKNNQLCGEWNNVIDEILNTGIVDKEELSAYKYRHINETLETTVKESSWKRELYEDILQDAIHNLQKLTASVKEYQREYGIQSFDIPDEPLAEIKKSGTL